MIRAVFFDIGSTLVAKKEWVPGSRELVAQLQQNKIAVGLISNTGELSRDELAELLPPEFDFATFNEELVFLSSEVGVAKPNVGIFLVAVQHANVSPWQTMFIGESLTESLAAQSAGMQAARVVDYEADFAAIGKFILSKNEAK